jgi:RNA polymerase sigma factor (sigma-70 family)
VRPTLRHQHPETEHGFDLPENELDALMRTPPGDTPTVDVHTMASRKERLIDALDQLPAEDRALFDAYYIERRSLRQIEAEFGIPKTTVARERDRIRADLERALT